VTFVFSAYTVVYLVGLVVSAVAAVYAFPNRRSPGGRWLFLMAAAAGAWSLAEAFDFSSSTLGSHILAAQLSYLGATTAPVFLLMFALEYSGRTRRRLGWSATILFIVPLFSILAAFTNQLHHLVWPGFSQLAGHPNIIVYQHGPVYWLVTLYSLAVVFLATVLLIDAAVHTRGTYRAQSVAVTIAAAFPWVAELGYSLAPSALPGLDPALTASITCAILAVTMSRYKLLDLVPVTREVLVEEMSDGIVVLDRAGRVLEVNPAAVRLLGLDRAPLPGTLGIDMFSKWTQAGREAVMAVYENRSTRLESPAGTVVGVERSALGDAGGPPAGDLFILRDITAQAQAEQELQNAYAALQTRMGQVETLQAELLEQATRDPLTGLHNRRYLAEELEREFGRASREDYPVSLLMFDVDRFKDVNDTCGHAAGDSLLMAIAEELRSGTRRGDVVCRYGGDEFVVLLPNATTANALSRAEGWRLRMRDVMRTVCDDRVKPTMSLGVATYPTHGTTLDGLVAASDHALYASKDSGRDRVSVAPEAPPDDAETASGE
jgi:diguanylate cyclase (GGDEF)-like protein/PAS domain S-box-containing protein